MEHDSSSPAVSFTLYGINTQQTYSTDLPAGIPERFIHNGDGNILLHAISQPDKRDLQCQEQIIESRRCLVSVSELMHRYVLD